MTATLSRVGDFLNRRSDFPSLKRTHNGLPLAYLDGPAGTQVPQAVIDTVSRYYTTSNANTHGFFVTTRETDEIIHDTRQAMADFLGADGPRTISFGANMTSLAFALSHAFARVFQPGDEVLVTQLDHEANRGPWLGLRRHGVVVREVRLKVDGTLDYDDFAGKITEKTRLVAMGYSANAMGTVNDVPLVRRLTHQAGAWLLVDAVHYAPHFPLSVRELGVDFLLCSAYKFYGPHVGILYSREGLLDRLPTDCLRTQDQPAPCRIETGTLNHAALAGTRAAVDYIAGLGTGASRRERVVEAMTRLAAGEHALAATLYAGLVDIPGVTVIGPSFAGRHRAPTVSFVLDGRDPVDVCRFLAERAICAWDGHFYAIRPMEVLGLLERGGVTRLGISLYNTAEEIQRVLTAVGELAAG